MLHDINDYISEENSELLAKLDYSIQRHQAPQSRQSLIEIRNVVWSAAMASLNNRQAMRRRFLTSLTCGLLYLLLFSSPMILQFKNTYLQITSYFILFIGFALYYEYLYKGHWLRNKIENAEARRVNTVISQILENNLKISRGPIG